MNKLSNIKISARIKAVYLVTLLLLFVGLIGCAPQQSSNTDEGGESTESMGIALAEWGEDSDCVSCHEVEGASGKDTNCTYSVHVVTVADCNSCHANNDGKLAQAHEKYATAKQPTKLKKTSIEDAVCLSCHVRADLAGKTEASTILIDDTGKTANPHGLPQKKEHDENIQCSNCHKMHRSENLTEQSQDTCINCHHENVYECHTCHE